MTPEMLQTYVKAFGDFTGGNAYRLAVAHGNMRYPFTEEFIAWTEFMAKQNA